MRVRMLVNGEPLGVAVEHARAEGATHLVVADDASELTRFLDAIRERPSALWLGARGRTSLWTWLETGKRLPGRAALHAYPIQQVERLHLTGGRATAAHEVVVKALWSGAEVACLPVDAKPAARRVHESVARGAQHAWFVSLRLCLPLPFLGVLSTRSFRALPMRRRLRQAMVELFVREPGPPRRVALSAGLGFFMGLAPIWGFQLPASLLAAHVIGLSKPVAALASHISIPILIPGILYASLVLGRFVLNDGAATTTLALAPSDFPAWILGSLILASLVGVVGSLLVYVVVRGVSRLRR